MNTTQPTRHHTINYITEWDRDNMTHAINHR